MVDLEVSINGGTPSHPFFRMFHEINQPAIGVPPFMETAVWSGTGLWRFCLEFPLDISCDVTFFFAGYFVRTIVSVDLRWGFTGISLQFRSLGRCSGEILKSFQHVCFGKMVW